MKSVLKFTLAAMTVLSTSTSMALDIAEIYAEFATSAVRATLIAPIAPTLTTLEELDNKIVVDAQEDALYFIGSQGVETPAKLQQAFNAIRKVRPNYTSVSDLQLAEDIAAGNIK